VARDVAGGVGGAEEGRLRRLGGCPLRHGFSENALTLEQRGLSLSDQDVGSVTRLLALFHQTLRRLPDLLRPDSNFGWSHRATEEMRANALGEVRATSRAHLRVVVQSAIRLSTPGAERPLNKIENRRLLSEKWLGAILPPPTTRAPGLTQAGVLLLWHSAGPTPFFTGVLQWNSRPRRARNARSRSR
jgi:hypothetical protein